MRIAYGGATAGPTIVHHSTRLKRSSLGHLVSESKQMTRQMAIEIRSRSAQLACMQRRSGGGRPDGLDGDLVAEALQATDMAALHGSAVASVEVLRPEIFVVGPWPSRSV